jgi:Na+-driven multidrug efflux pump
MAKNIENDITFGFILGGMFIVLIYFCLFACYMMAMLTQDVTRDIKRLMQHFMRINDLQPVNNDYRNIEELV